MVHFRAKHSFKDPHNVAKIIQPYEVNFCSEMHCFRQIVKTHFFQISQLQMAKNGHVCRKGQTKIGMDDSFDPYYKTYLKL